MKNTTQIITGTRVELLTFRKGEKGTVVELLKTNPNPSLDMFGIRLDTDSDKITDMLRKELTLI